MILQKNLLPGLVDFLLQGWSTDKSGSPSALAFVRADHRSVGITSLKHSHDGGTCPPLTAGLVDWSPTNRRWRSSFSVHLSCFICIFHLHWHILAVENEATVFWNGKVPARRSDPVLVNHGPICNPVNHEHG